MCFTSKNVFQIMLQYLTHSKTLSFCFNENLSNKHPLDYVDMGRKEEKKKDPKRKWYKCRLCNKEYDSKRYKDHPNSSYGPGTRFKGHT